MYSLTLTVSSYSKNQQTASYPETRDQKKSNPGLCQSQEGEGVSVRCHANTLLDRALSSFWMSKMSVHADLSRKCICCTARITNLLTATWNYFRDIISILPCVRILDALTLFHKRHPEFEAHSGTTNEVQHPIYILLARFDFAYLFGTRTAIYCSVDLQHCIKETNAKCQQLVKKRRRHSAFLLASNRRPHVEI